MLLGLNALDIDELRSCGAKPRLHPNGFIQLDLPGRRRLHVWPDAPVRERSPAAPIHDHVYGFTSSVCLGTLVNRTIRLIEHPEGEYAMYGIPSYAVDPRDFALERVDDKRYAVFSTVEVRLDAPTRYAFAPYEFHETEAIGLTATIIELGEPDRSRLARVACRLDRPIPPVFRREGDSEELTRLWTFIARACREAR